MPTWYDVFASMLIAQCDFSSLPVRDFALFAISLRLFVYVWTYCYNFMGAYIVAYL